jgi:hypothetical protein
VLLLRQAGNDKAVAMFQPVVDTLADMLHGYATEHGDVQFDQAAVRASEIASRTAPLQLGDLFIWVGALGAERVPWMELDAVGVRTVYYRTEPIIRPCPPPRWRLSETWEYTRAHVGSCKRDGAPLSRYIPPGALGTALPVGELPDSKELIFLENMRAPSRRSSHAQRGRHCFDVLRRKFSREGRNALRAEAQIWPEAQFASLMRQHAIFLTLHTACDTPDQPIEALHVCKLLEYGRLVIAERSNAADERMFAGLVTFGNVSEIGELYSSIMQMPLRERAALAESRKQAFRDRFSPHRLLNESGARALLDRIRAARRPAAAPGMAPQAGAPISALQKCRDRLPPRSAAHILATRALATGEAQWSRLVFWHQATDDAVAAVVHGRAQAARCAAVGNSPLLADALYGAEIDGEHEVVLRFNFAPIVGHERQVGAKTQLRMMAQLYVPANRSEGSVVLHRYNPRFARLRAEEDAMGNGNYTVVELIGWPLTRIGTSRLWNPSSGVAGMVLLMRSCASVSMYGFDLSGNAPGHYFDEEMEWLLPNVRMLLASEPWRLQLAPHSVQAPNIAIEEQPPGADGSSRPPLVKVTKPGAYNQLVVADYIRMNQTADQVNHNLGLERAALKDFIAAGCLVHRDALTSDNVHVTSENLSHREPQPLRSSKTSKRKEDARGN